MGTFAGLITAVALVCIAVVHGTWARQIWWPLGNPEQFRLTVMGPAARLPRPIESWIVAGLLIAAAGLVSVTALTDEAGVVRFGATIAGGVLALRGAAGLVVSTLIRRDGPFARWDRRLYSPLCLVLAIGVAVVVG